MGLQDHSHEFLLVLLWSLLHAGCFFGLPLYYRYLRSLCGAGFTTYAASRAGFACGDVLGSDTVKHQLLRGIMTVAVQEAPAAASSQAAPNSVAAGLHCNDASALQANVQRSWEHFRSLGSPQWHVAPMVDQVRLRLCQQLHEYVCLPSSLSW